MRVDLQKRTSAKTAQRGRKTAAATKRGAASSARGARSTYIDDDVEDDDDDDDAGPKKAIPTPSSQVSRHTLYFLHVSNRNPDRTYNAAK